MFSIKKIKFNFLYAFLYLTITWFLVSCSNETFQKIGVTKKKTKQFSVTRKAPLEMPPDMMLRPPQSINRAKNNNNSSLVEEDMRSLDAILNDEVKENKIKINKTAKEERILKKILNTKATVLK